MAATLAPSQRAVEARQPNVAVQAALRQIISQYANDANKDDEDPAITPNPKERSVSLVKLGWEFVKVGDLPTALKRFLLAVKMDESNASSFFGAGYVCSVAGNLDEAITFYRLSLKCDDKSAPTFANLAKALLLQDKYSTEAPHLLDAAIQSDPNYVESYVTYSRYFADRDDWTSAGAKMEQAISLGHQVDPSVRKDFKKHGIYLSGGGH
jgi:Tfp pilus assembly protein PilF